ncbi:unnamed protein product [Prorocentrum cordatum]|uniref:Uncharacterized protein n=1 Tax=Prorocentrum cordatum TaxID=2364126 RepID=A0ABN9RLY3_9DINO|nr:unnamed protein product [Polarella glacialis]
MPKRAPPPPQGGASQRRSPFCTKKGRARLGGMAPGGLDSGARAGPGASAAKGALPEVRVLPDERSLEWPFHEDCHRKIWAVFRDTVKSAGVPPEPEPTDEEETARLPAGAVRLDLKSNPRRDTTSPLWQDQDFFEKHGEGIMDCVLFPREAQLKWDALITMHEQCRRLGVRNRKAIAAASPEVPDEAVEGEGRAPSAMPSAGSPGISADME